MQRKHEPIRGCGTRIPGGVYATTPLSRSGAPVESFLLDPPQHEVPVEGKLEPVVDAFGLSPIGVTVWQDRKGVNHLLDWVGAQHYPNVADFIEEVRALGVSRRVPMTLNYERLGPDSRLLLFHNRAWITNAFDYFLEEREIDDPKRRLCPRKKPQHAADRSLDMCSRLFWQDVRGGEPIKEGSRRVRMEMPSFEYEALATPDDLVPKYEVAMFAAFPIVQLEVIRSDDGRHRDGLEAAAKSGIQVSLEDF